MNSVSLNRSLIIDYYRYHHHHHHHHHHPHDHYHSISNNNNLNNNNTVQQRQCYLLNNWLKECLNTVNNYDNKSNSNLNAKGPYININHNNSNNDNGNISNNSNNSHNETILLNRKSHNPANFCNNLPELYTQLQKEECTKQYKNNNGNIYNNYNFDVILVSNEIIPSFPYLRENLQYNNNNNNNNSKKKKNKNNISGTNNYNDNYNNRLNNEYYTSNSMIGNTEDNGNIFKVNEISQLFSTFISISEHWANNNKKINNRNNTISIDNCKTNSLDDVMLELIQTL